MNVPTTGQTITVEGYGTGLFVKGPNPEEENPEIWMKFEGGKDGDEIIPIDWDEFKEKRVYPEQQPDPEELSDWGNWDEMVKEIEKKFGVNEDEDETE